MRAEEYRIIRDLLSELRQAALGTLREGLPFVSMVAFAAEEDLSAILLHLSRLAPHTGQLLADARSSLLVMQPHIGDSDPQILPRITLLGEAHPLERHAEQYSRARARYLELLPHAEQLFEFPDFQLFRMQIHEARYIGGFARAYTLGLEDLRKAAQSLIA